MKIVLQRVNKASVSVDGQTVGEIEKGYLLLLGVAEGDTKDMADKLIDKISKLRIFPDENDKINLSIADVDGSVLVVSQFTLLADCRKGNRPSFTASAKPDFANEMYEYVLKICEGKFKKVEKGIFGEDMKVSLENDGPFTLVLEA